MATIRELSVIMGRIAKAFPQSPGFAARTEAYYEILQHIPADAIDAARVQCAAQNSAFPPSAGQIYNAACDLFMPAAPSPGSAWSEVVRLAREIGAAGTPNFTNPLAAQAVEGIGGWEYVCHSEDTMADRARFIQEYENLVKRFEYEARMLPQVKESRDRLLVRSGAKQLQP